MKAFPTVLFVSLLLLAIPAYAVTPLTPTLDLEKKIAYQQGQFGALYARCGSPEDRAVIGGSLTSWRTETFRGYSGTPDERAGVQKAFDEAAVTVNADPSACQDWIKQAAATWHGIIQLAQYGIPLDSNP